MSLASRSRIRAAIGEFQEVHFALPGNKQNAFARARAHGRSVLGARHGLVVHADREQNRYHSDARVSHKARWAWVSGQTGRFA